MKNFKIKTHRKGNRYQTAHFYVLNKGKNAGRPSKKPICNSFVVFTNTEEETEKLYWICNFLHHGNSFKPYLTGAKNASIHIGSVRKLLNKVSHNYSGAIWKERFKILQDIETAENDLRRKANNIGKHKTLLMCSYVPQVP